MWYYILSHARANVKKILRRMVIPIIRLAIGEFYCRHNLPEHLSLWKGSMPDVSFVCGFLTPTFSFLDFLAIYKGSDWEPQQVSWTGELGASWSWKRWAFSVVRLTRSRVCFVFSLLFLRCWVVVDLASPNRCQTWREKSRREGVLRSVSWRRSTA